MTLDRIKTSYTIMCTIVHTIKSTFYLAQVKQDFVILRIQYGWYFSFLYLVGTRVSANIHIVFKHCNWCLPAWTFISLNKENVPFERDWTSVHLILGKPLSNQVCFRLLSHGRHHNKVRFNYTILKENTSLVQIFQSPHLLFFYTWNVNKVISKELKSLYL